MAYVLSLRPHSPLKRSFSDSPYLNSCSPLREGLLAPLIDITTRNASACSLYSLGNNRPGTWSRGEENTPPLTSRTQIDLISGDTEFPFGLAPVVHPPRKRTCGDDRSPPSFLRVTAPSNPYSKTAYEVQDDAASSFSSESSSEAMEVEDSNFEESELFNLYEAIRVPLPEGRASDNTAGEPDEEPETAVDPAPTYPQPFRRWMSTLRRRHAQRRKDHSTDIPRASFDMMEGDGELGPLREVPQSTRRTSESLSSSMGGVVAMKSASITIAGTSIAPRSETGLQGKSRMGNRSSYYSDARKSGESHRGTLGPVIDESAWLRSLQRRRVVEEIIASEESYVADLKVLINVSLLHVQCAVLIMRAVSGLLRDPYRTSHIIRSNKIIHTTEHLPDSTASRGSARRAPSGGPASRLHKKRTSRDLSHDQGQAHPVP